MFRYFDTPIRSGTCAPSLSRAAAPSGSRAGSSQPGRRSESARLGIRCNGRPMQPAALRVLETTWRVWREPLA